MMKLLRFVKEEAVLCIAALLAVISCFFVTPDRQYWNYIDFRTLALLFCLMAVMAGLQNMGVFETIACSLVKRIKSMRGLCFLLVLLCFFSSMLITNDVALITFVPFSITVLNLIKQKKFLIPLVVMETIGANLGSMFTPMGNPQNLYLYSQSGMSLLSFMKLLLPYTVASLLLLSVWILLQKNKVEIRLEWQEEGKRLDIKKLVFYLLLFLFCLLAVIKLVDYGILFFIILITVAVFDGSVLKKIDYSLLLTFVAFFIFVGNMGRMDVFRLFLEKIIEERTVLCSIALSQIISNVPAALLLSGFTSDWGGLLIGTNVGGLGTLIASMASLISFKYVGKQESKGKYLLYFTIANLIFLCLMLLCYFFFNQK